MVNEVVNKSNIESEDWGFISTKIEHFTEDQVIDAYLKGKVDGVKEIHDIKIDTFKANVKKSATFTANIAVMLAKRNFDLTSAHLRVNSYDNFSILFTISEDDFLSDEILEVYQESNKLLESIREKYFNLFFSFSDKSEDFNETMLACDGYTLVYNKNR